MTDEVGRVLDRLQGATAGGGDTGTPASTIRSNMPSISVHSAAAAARLRPNGDGSRNIVRVKSASLSCLSLDAIVGHVKTRFPRLRSPSLCATAAQLAQARSDLSRAVSDNTNDARPLRDRASRSTPAMRISGTSIRQCRCRSAPPYRRLPLGTVSNTGFPIPGI
jgi:hypothetical protein